MKTATTVTTSHASRYLQQLCKHFAHKIEVDYNAETGSCVFPHSRADLAARDEGLDITIRADNEENLQKGRAVIWNHLARFAFREDLGDPEWTATERA